MSAEPNGNVARLHRVGRAILGAGRGIANIVYGTVVAIATLSAAYPGERDPWKLEVLVASTVFAVWIAHLYAHTLAESIEHNRRLTREGLFAIARRELGILFAAAPPIVALTLGTIGLVSEHTAVWLAISIGLVTLAAQGVRYARIERLSRKGTLVAVAGNFALGLFVVLLKQFVVH